MEEMEEYQECQKFKPSLDISGIDNNELLFIELAVPGFSKDELLIELIENSLIITGTPNEGNEYMFYEDDVKVFHKEIIVQPFRRKIFIKRPYVTGTFDSALNNGILTISILRDNEYSDKIIEIK